MFYHLYAVISLSSMEYIVWIILKHNIYELSNLYIYSKYPIYCLYMFLVS